MQDKQAEIDLTQNMLNRGFTQPANWGASLESLENDLEALRLESVGDPVLDAGCGVGTYSLLLGKRNWQVVGIDISREALRFAKDRADREGIGFMPVVADLEQLPFKEGVFGLCFGAGVLHHCPELPAVVNEVVRVTKSGATVAFIEPNGSNAILRMSSPVKKLLRVDTPNERLHTARDYMAAFRRAELTDLHVNPSYSTIPRTFRLGRGNNSRKLHYVAASFLLKSIFSIRRLALWLLSKALPPALGGTDLSIAGTRSDK